MSMRPALTAITLALLWSGIAEPARAGERKLFENVRGWEVERNIAQTGRYTCQMSYTYQDKDDNNAENAVVFSQDEGKVNLVLGYANWAWDKDETVQASLSVDKQVLYPKQGWTGDAKILWSQLPETIIPKLLKGKQIVLKFDDGAADFSITGFSDAFDGLKRCNAAGAAPAPQASSPPNQTRLQAYFLGLILQKTAATCAVSTTGPQRAAVDAKVAALRAEFAAIEPAIQDEIKKQGGTPDCPKGATDIASFDTELKSYVDLSPEDYVASADKRSAAREAARKAETEARAKAEAEAKMRSEIEAKMRSEAEAKAKAESEAKARAEMEARIRAEVEAKLKAEAEAKAAPKTDAEPGPKL